MPSQDVGGNGESRPSKRRRIPMACVPCRTRKSRCDGGRPVCETCSQLGYECKYTEPASSANIIVGKEYLSGLQERLEAVEKSIRYIHTRLGDDVSSVIQARESSEPENDADAMGAIRFADESESGYFGPSSNIAFLRTIADVMVQESNVTLQSPNDTVTGASGGRQPRSSSSTTCQPAPRSQSSATILPDLLVGDEATQLLQKFFSNTGYLFPYLHEGVFMKKYQGILATPQQLPSRSWLGLLNIVFAMSISTSFDEGLSAPQRRERSDYYVQKALGLSGSQIMRGASLDTVHFLLLWGQYLQGTQKSLEAWTVQGLTVKAAFQLGLHRAAASQKFTPVEREIRKRTWLGCVCLDRTMSLTFGRPPAIPHSFVRDEMPTPFSLCDSPESAPPTVEQANPGNISFFTATIRLYSVLATVVDQLYGQNLGYDETVSMADILTRLFNIEGRLADWERALPHSLRIISPDEIGQSLDHQDSDSASELGLKLRAILTLRYLNIRLLLHRPILLQCLRKQKAPTCSSHEDALLQQVGPNSIKTCLDGAVHIINSVHATVMYPGSHREILGAWWFSLYYTFNAALTIFACFLSCRPTSSRLQSPTLIDNARTLELLETALQCLELLDKDNSTVDRCRHCLQILTKATTQMAESFTAGQNASTVQWNLMDELFDFHDLSTNFASGFEGEFQSSDATEFWSSTGF